LRARPLRDTLSKGGALAAQVDIDGYVAGWRERAEVRQREQQELNRSARARLPEVVRCLVEQFGATRVVLFGSLARDELEPESDIDLLVEGVAPDRLLEGCACASRLMGTWWVDLVPLERAHPKLLEHASQQGEVLHGPG